MKSQKRERQNPPSSKGSYSCSSSLHAHSPLLEALRRQEPVGCQCMHAEQGTGQHPAAEHCFCSMSSGPPPDGIDHDERERGNEPRQVLHKGDLRVAGRARIHPKPPCPCSTGLCQGLSTIELGTAAACMLSCQKSWDAHRRRGRLKLLDRKPSPVQTRLGHTDAEC